MMWIRIIDPRPSWIDHSASKKPSCDAIMVTEVPQGKPNKAYFKRLCKNVRANGKPLVDESRLSLLKTQIALPFVLGWQRFTTEVF